MTENNRQQKERGLFLTKEMLEGLEFFCPNTPVIVYRVYPAFLTAIQKQALVQSSLRKGQLSTGQPKINQVVAEVRSN